MDRFASIAAFVGVAKSGGFSAAARCLNMSTTMVSNHVHALEKSLGVRLLERTTRRVRLTEIGRDYYERCNLILHEVEEADAAAGALQVTPRGRLRVYCHQALAGIIAPVINDFLSRFLEVSIDLRTGDVVIDLVQEGFDVAITPLPPTDATLVRRRLAGWALILSGAPAYLQKHPVPHHPADLVRHNCLQYAYSPSGDEWRFLDPAGNPVVVRVSGSLTTTSIETLRAAAVAGLGLGLMSPMTIGDLLASGALVPLLHDYTMGEIEVVALYPYRRHMRAKTLGFIEMVADAFANEAQRSRVAVDCAAAAEASASSPNLKQSPRGT
jgi:DNA-binding transcriptional LysR family regulator